MNIKSIYLYLLLLVGVVASSCDDQRMDGMVDPTVFLVNDGVQKLTMYNTGLPFEYNLGIYKSGLDESSSSITTNISDEAGLSAYNQENDTEYVLLPADCYSVTSNNITIVGNNPNAGVEVIFNPAKILELPDYSDKEYVLLVEIVSSDIAINPDKAISVLVPNVLEPIVYLSKTGLHLNSLSDSGDRLLEFEFSVAMNFENIFDLQVNFAINQDLINEYNNANGTVYSLLPEESYTLESNPLSVTKGNSEGVVTIVVDRDKMSYGSYILPMQLSSLSNYNISESENSCLIAVNYEAALLDRTGWEVIDFSTEEPAEGAPNGLAASVLDDDVNTFWHSKWAGGLAPLPHHITVDMKKELTVCQIDLVRRKNNGDLKAGEFYASLDNENWDKIGTYQTENTNDPQPFVVTKTQARYIKFVVTESNRSGIGSLAELYVRGIE